MSPETPAFSEDWMPVRISRELAATLFVRDKDGRRLTWDWGQPDADGFYTPTITTSEDEWFEARQQGRDRDLREWARLKGLEDLARELVDRWHNGTITRPEAEIIEAMARALSEQGTR